MNAKSFTAGVVLISGLLWSWPAMPGEPPGTTNAEDTSRIAKSRYDTLLENLIKRVQSRDQSITDAKDAARAFKELRFAYAETPQYNPYGGIKATTAEAMFAAFNNKEYKMALEYAEKILKENFVDIDAHLVSSAAYEKTGDKEKADYHRAIANILILSVLGDGNGEKPESAIEVISTDEEYAILNISGLRETSQAELLVNGHNYDKLTVNDPVSGKTFEMYFCIDKPYNWLQKSLKKSR